LAQTEDVGEKGEVKVTKAAEEVGSEDAMPEWKRLSIERSLQGPRARAQARTDRFVGAAMEIMGESGSIDFTVQDVVDRSKMSIRTFYNFFASKDDLLVAVHETILATEVVPRMRAQCDAQSDPVDRVKAYVLGIYELTSNPGPASRALTTYSNRLLETRPEDLERAFKPQIDLVVELISDAKTAGRLHPSLSTEAAARLLHHTVLATVHARILGDESEEANRITAADLWTFCSSGIGVTAG
jgi:AcrR family transcriptional regulator